MREYHTSPGPCGKKGPILIRFDLITSPSDSYKDRAHLLARKLFGWSSQESYAWVNGLRDAQISTGSFGMVCDAFSAWGNVYECSPNPTLDTGL